jgi:hypothetical protein
MASKINAPKTKKVIHPGTKDKVVLSGRFFITSFSVMNRFGIPAFIGIVEILSDLIRDVSICSAHDESLITADGGIVFSMVSCFANCR